MRFVAWGAWLALAPFVAAGAEGAERPEAKGTERLDVLVSVERGTLPSLAGAETVEHLLAVDGRLLAIGAQAAWLLDRDESRWAETSWRPGSVVAAGSDEGYAFVLFAADGQHADRAALLSISGTTSGDSSDGPSGDSLVARSLPRLPQALRSARGAILNGRLYVVGSEDGADGERARLFEIGLAAPADTWSVHDGWSGGGRVSSAIGQTFALFVTVSDGARDRMWRWKAEEGWVERAPLGGTVARGSPAALGQAHVLYLVNEPAIAQPPVGAEPPDATSTAKLVSFHTITGSWATLDDAPLAGVRVGAAWKQGMVWLRVPPDGAAAEFGSAQLSSRGHLLHWLDWVIIVVYLVSMLGMGLYFYLREKRNSTADFFVGGRSIPFWAAGISLYAANTSSISYIAIPATAFETNWQYLMNNLTAVLGLTFVAVWIVPLLRRLNLMSVFTYLETRFHPLIRSLSSALFMAVQIGSRMSVILFLPSLAIATITGIDVTWSIVIMAVFTMIYTALGGMKAVVWTDFVQLIVKMGGIAFAIGFIVLMLDGGSGELLQIARAEDKMKLLDFSFDLTKATVWGFVFLVLFDVVLTFPKDQVLMQRVLSTKNDRDAGRSIWTFAAVMIPGGFMFYFTGTALYAYYKTHPERLDPLLTIDATFPLFIAAELPLGIKGLIIAGILAAAMATLSSIMNSVATLASVDFYEKIVRKPDPKVSVRFAEGMTIVTGLLGMGVALLLSRYDVHSLFDVSIELAGLLGGGFAGAYTLGMFTRRANWQGVMIGVAVAITLTTIAWWFDLVHPYFYLGVSIMLCIVVGWLASWLFPAPSDEALAGLTIRKDGPAGR